MSDLLDEVLRHQFIYLPREPGVDTMALGARLGPAVARTHGEPLTVLAPTKVAITDQPALAKLPIVTERSGHVVDGGVVLAWCPTYKLMEKSQHFRRSVVILVEWIPAEFATWARLCGAFNVVTGEVLDPALGHEEARALEGIAAAGYKGWHDVTSQQMTLRYLDDFSKVSHYDRELVLAYARRTKSERSIATLAKILDEFEASVRTDWAKPDDEVPPASRDW